MRRVSLMVAVLIVGLVLCRGSVQPVHAADYPIYIDCPTNIGVFDNTTRTCTLMGNVYGSIEIQSDNVTLDGQGYAIIGPGINGYPLYGVYIYGYHTGITIKNLTISGWNTGIWMYRAYYTTIVNTTIADNGVGISLLDSPFVTLSSNTIRANATGISAGNSFDGLTMRGNALENNSLRQASQSTPRIP
jgi:parallel beta-helix repeat protein